ncbi:hypothetical protein HGRIS_000454 [Hohenbuehelia grisea]|uniref:C2H2-type domain-containing protein n=1 Tax=Hohenbuehelia grisea TaxID=104357 RepID=A0ABR3JR28_9AGAR
MNEPTDTPMDDAGLGEEEEWDEEGYDEEEDDGLDAEAEAEAIARQLGEALWADIAKAQANNAALVQQQQQPPPPPPTEAQVLQGPSKKEEAALITMKAILGLIESDQTARTTLSLTVIPNTNGANVFDMLVHTINVRRISKDLAMTLSPIMVDLAKSEGLFGSLRLSDAPAIQLDLGKRKREEAIDEAAQAQARAWKRQCNSSSNQDLQTQIGEAIRVIVHAFSLLSPNHPPDPAFISSIQQQLHQVFLFAVTSSAPGGPELSALQELSGLIQVVGVLSGIQIGPSHAPGSTTANQTWASQAEGAFSDIGTAVYPCLVPGCRKTFSRLYSLRAHQRVHATHRPFRCQYCPASFVRNHDLKRHAKLHDMKGWKCGGCSKQFSRRDAIKRHKNNSRTRELGGGCADAEVLEVQLDSHSGGEISKEERRAKVWLAGQSHGGAGTAPGVYPLGTEDLEDGEVQPAVIMHAQSAVMGLHGLLQGYVANALNAQSGTAFAAPTASDGQATLASVIARAQSQNMPLGIDGSATEPLPMDSAMAGEAQPEPIAPSDAAALPDADASPPPPVAAPSLSMYGLSDEQAKMLEQAIAIAASAAQAQAEAEAALEEEDDEDYEEDEEYEEGEPGGQASGVPQ